MSEVNTMIENFPVNHSLGPRRIQNLPFAQPPIRRNRGVSSPQPLNRQTPNVYPNANEEIPNINRTMSPRVGPLRPNLSPLARPNLAPASRPNLSPLPSPSAESTSYGNPIQPVVQVPTPVNMVDRLTAPTNRSTSNPFALFARRLSPRAYLRTRQSDPSRRSLDDTRLHPRSRDISPTYEDNRPQSLFPAGLADASLIMNQLLASNPPAPAPSPALRRFRNLTPKLLLRRDQVPTSPGRKIAKKQLGPSPLTNPPINAKCHNRLDDIPSEVLELIFDRLLNPQDIKSCTAVCHRWQRPAQSSMSRLIKRMPYVGLPMLRCLRVGLGNSNLGSNELVLHQLVQELSSEYCRCNPSMVSKFHPKDPELIISNLFWTFLFLDREFTSNALRRVTCDQFVKLVHRVIYHEIDKATLKDLYYDIKSNPLLRPQENDDGTIYIPAATGIQALPRKLRQWWRRITGRTGTTEAFDADLLSDVEEEDPFRPL